MTPEDFSSFHKPSTRQWGGGVGLFVSSAHQYTAISLSTQTSFEAISGKLECGQSCLIILNIDRPPGPATAFFSELQEMLSYISTLPHDLGLMGDFNLPIDSSSSDAGRLSGMLDSFDLHQCVDFPSHIHGHSLDLMICSPGCNVLSVSASDLISDHCSVVANLQISSNHSRTIPQTIKYRKLQSIYTEAFEAAIQNSDLNRYPKTNATELALQYYSILQTLINLHAPLVPKKISIKPPNPWMTPAILTSKQYLVWRRNPTPLNRSRLTRQTHSCNRHMSRAKSLPTSAPSWKNPPSIRIAWIITSQCLILASFPRFLRK